MKAALVAASIMLLTVNSEAKRSPDPRAQTIQRFFQLTASGTGTVRDCQRLFGELDAEMNLALAIQFPKRATYDELTSTELAFVSDRLEHPVMYRCAMLECLQREFPQAFRKGVPRPQVRKVDTGPTGAVTYRAKADHEELVFLFARDSTSIVGIVFPDGSNLGIILDKCEKRARHASAAGDR